MQKFLLLAHWSQEERRAESETKLRGNVSVMTERQGDRCLQGEEIRAGSHRGQRHRTAGVVKGVYEWGVETFCGGEIWGEKGSSELGLRC